MNQTSPVITGGAAAVAGALVPVIAWIGSLFHVEIPVQVQISIASGIVAGAHYFGNRIASKNSAASATSAQ